MDTVAGGEIRLLVHGPDTETDVVSAAVFAYQLTVLVRALRAADKATNGRPAHDYVIAKLHTSTPTAILAERPLPKLRGQIFAGHSAIEAFEECANAITIGEQARALLYGNCVRQIAKFSRTGYSEIWTRDANVLRVDPFLTEQAQSIVAPDTGPQAPGPEAATGWDWFKGAATGSFDGEIKAADLRGARPLLKLVLTAGGAQIDCVCRAEDIEEIRAALNLRARVFGRAIYDGKSGLPRRIEVSKIAVVKPVKNFARWKGKFKPFEADPWEGDG